MIDIGTLVKYHYDDDIGIVTDFLRDDEDLVNDYYYVRWSDGTDGYHLASEFEVIA